MYISPLIYNTWQDRIILKIHKYLMKMKLMHIWLIIRKNIANIPHIQHHSMATFTVLSLLQLWFLWPDMYHDLDFLITLATLSLSILTLLLSLRSISCRCFCCNSRAVFKFPFWSLLLWTSSTIIKIRTVIKAEKKNHF